MKLSLSCISNIMYPNKFWKGKFLLQFNHFLFQIKIIMAITPVTLSPYISECMTDCSLLNQSNCQPIQYTEKVTETILMVNIEYQGGCYNSSQFRRTSEFLRYTQVWMHFMSFNNMLPPAPFKTLWENGWILL